MDAFDRQGGALAGAQADPLLAEAIDALLPQTQCTRCGYPTCRDYARAIATGKAAINQCPPGGAAGIAALAALLGLAPRPLDPAHGVEAAPVVALIDEETCIGCTKCIQACPVDAIVGTGKLMHTVIADECTGCGLCVPACPVDCIALPDIADEPLPRAAVLARARSARERFEARRARIAAVTVPVSRSAAAASVAHAAAAVAAAAAPAATATGTAPISRSAVLDAIARGRARKQDRQA